MPTRPGRPPLDPDAKSKSVVVSLTLSAKMYDGLYRRAVVQRLTVPDVIRRDLQRATGKKDETPGA